jgi:ornithine cyclodeaminase/alanine dehydrogenase-like protein (mu-crystallin family)
MTLVLSDADVRRLLPMSQPIAAMEVAFRDYANAAAVNIPRIR